MKKIFLVAIAVLSGFVHLRAEPLQIRLTGSPQVATKADGVIGQDEYAAKLKDPVTGIEIFASADTAALHMALKSPGSGWLAIGLGSSGMNGAVMAIALKDAQGKWAVEQHLGKSLYRHSRVDKPNLISKAAWQEGGKTCLEFSIPLQFAGGRRLAPGSPAQFILAYHKDKAGLSKHTKKSSGTLVLEK